VAHLYQPGVADKENGIFLLAGFPAQPLLPHRTKSL
jgi:hypothetical protein